MSDKKTGEKINYMGGQAIIEGVMMRGQNVYAMAVRKPDKEIEVIKRDITPKSKKYPFLKLPIIRGVVAFVDSLVIGVNALTVSADLALGEQEPDPPGKFEAFLTRVFGEKLNNIMVGFSVVIAIAFSLGLFFLLPTWLAGFIRLALGGHARFLGVVEGLTRLAILIIYMYVISLSKDIKRVFEYHGAEHKTINCYESGDSLTVDNALAHTRFHKRCGTSFLILVMLVSMVVFFFITTDNYLARFGYRLLLVPVIAGLSFELIRWAGRSDSVLVNIISWPGVCLQKLTTKEPDAEQVETAIAALKEVLENGQPEEKRD
ncbi:MAG: DUF1385 domain-containing protein [Clostridiales bacterium]|nr:DUF1385 domain-containing protein [Clostridiales bacterium]